MCYVTTNDVGTPCVDMYPAVRNTWNVILTFKCEMYIHPLAIDCWQTSVSYARCLHCTAPNLVVRIARDPPAARRARYASFPARFQWRWTSTFWTLNWHTGYSRPGERSLRFCLFFLRRVGVTGAQTDGRTDGRMHKTCNAAHEDGCANKCW